MHPVRIERTSQALQASANPSQLKVQILAGVKVFETFSWVLEAHLQPMRTPIINWGPVRGSNPQTLP